MSKQKVAATLTIHDAREFTDEGRAEVVAWIRKQADYLDEYYLELSKRFTAKYWYNDEDLN